MMESLTFRSRYFDRVHVVDSVRALEALVDDLVGRHKGRVRNARSQEAPMLVHVAAGRAAGYGAVYAADGSVRRRPREDLAKIWRPDSTGSKEAALIARLMAGSYWVHEVFLIGTGGRLIAQALRRRLDAEHGQYLTALGAVA